MISKGEFTNRVEEECDQKALVETGCFSYEPEDQWAYHNVYVPIVLRTLMMERYGVIASCISAWLHKK